MSKIFSGDTHDLDRPDGATAVSIDVLMPAVSDLASDDWDFRSSARHTASCHGGGGSTRWPAVALHHVVTGLCPQDVQ